MIDKRIHAYQNDLITKHCEEVQNIYNQMRGWRHDYHNHIQTMKAHLALDQTTELEEYLGKLDTDLSDVDTVVKTGNIMVDAILNSKLSLANARKININAKAIVPSSMNISEIDLCVIIVTNIPIGINGHRWTENWVISLQKAQILIRQKIYAFTD
jgi:sensor histidine kinase regulating citrate/malate metabolism